MNITGNITSASQSDDTQVVLNSRNISQMDEDTYFCSGTYGNGSVFEESVNITVRGKLNATQSILISTSHKSYNFIRLQLASKHRYLYIA